MENVNVTNVVLILMVIVYNALHLLIKVLMMDVYLVLIFIIFVILAMIQKLV